MTGLGVAVALLHESTPAEGLPVFVRLRPDRVQHCADIICRARPDVARRAERLDSRLRLGIPETEPTVVLHGDCHPGNALVDGDAVALIDLDQLGLGPAAADLGSLVARLRYAATLGDLGVLEAEELEARFLSGYAARRPLPSPSSLAWHTAAALLAERALRAVNRVNRAALAGLDELIAAADAALDKGVHT
jgi:Ser/Thr protein kinase RdoA (MazF antagonist)